ncbi:MAG: NAD(P)H-dependent oxidoreductase [Bacteroidia bacterium]|nr:NAD(P)H-dependent oxidoreductase [Bacteroidia bacterium]
MKIKLSAFIACGLLFTASSAFPQSSGAYSPVVKATSEQAKIKVLVVYYSTTGNTEKMANAVVEGAMKIPGVEAAAKTTDQVIESDLKTADAIVLGSPTYYGNMAGPMKSFIDEWWLKYHITLVDKVGGAFATGGSATGGKEQVIHSLITSLLNAGMIITGPIEGPFGLAGATALDPVNEAGLKEAMALGERVASVALKLKK